MIVDWEKDYTRLRDLVVRVATPMIGPDEAEQIVSYVYEATHGNEYNDNDAYVAGTARRKCVNHLRQMNAKGKAQFRVQGMAKSLDFEIVGTRGANEVFGETIGDPRNDYARLEAQMLWDDLAAKVPYASYVLANMDGDSVRVIAEREGIPHGTARARLDAAKRRIGQLLGVKEAWLR
jgi:DNA-directed RNA polymerase specialized sigma24 family protein